MGHQVLVKDKGIYGVCSYSLNKWKEGYALNYEVTKEILEALKLYIGNMDIKIATDNKDWKNRSYKSDFIEIDKKNNVGFEVLETEIIVYFFTEHQHFEDYTIDLSEGKDKYIVRAKDFLQELFQYKIYNTKYFKGNKLYSERYSIYYGDGRKDKDIGYTINSLMTSMNPFGKKYEKNVVWFFDKVKGCFVTRNDRTYDEEAVEIIEVDDNCYVEIFCKHNSYTYNVMAIEYDDYNCMYYWAPARNEVEPGWYDTKDRAIEEMWENLKYTNKQLEG